MSAENFLMERKKLRFYQKSLVNLRLAFTATILLCDSSALSEHLFELLVQNAFCDFLPSRGCCYLTAISSHAIRYTLYLAISVLCGTFTFSQLHCHFPQKCKSAALWHNENQKGGEVLLSSYFSSLTDYQHYLLLILVQTGFFLKNTGI